MVAAQFRHCMRLCRFADADACWLRYSDALAVLSIPKPSILAACEQRLARDLLSFRLNLQIENFDKMQRGCAQLWSNENWFSESDNIARLS
jgi:hypothetical protein